jgi:tRNA U34 5-carboxymethylaminomethyl modifying GTPase MnmE/TrmE
MLTISQQNPVADEATPDFGAKFAEEASGLNANTDYAKLVMTGDAVEGRDLEKYTKLQKVLLLLQGIRRMRRDLEKNTKLQKECEGFLSVIAEPQGNRPRIAAWGLVKAGKSSLLNMLSDHVEDEYFKVGVTSTTHENKELSTEKFILVDTPGLDASDADNWEAVKGLYTADIILFVHAPKGELERVEMELVDRVKSEFPEKIGQRFILILTHLDEDQNRSLEAIRNRIMEQLRSGFGIKPAFFLVSNTRYQKGASENKENMVEKSGIPALSRYLGALSAKIQGELDADRRQRRANRKQALIAELDQVIGEETELAREIWQKKEEKVRKFDESMLILRNAYEATEANIADVERKLKNL